MSDNVIKVENLSKQYRIGAKEGYKTFRETLIDSAKAPFLLSKNIAKRVLRPLPSAAAHESESQETTIWALKDVSFEVKQGEVVGIIGRNGAGKSTLLKVLSKITEPTEGRVELRGRVGSLLEVGTGFHPELTGHENVYLYGAILGMDRWEVTRKFDEIIAFAELEKFVDTPVKRYSSGMYMRLAFAVAAHLEPEILLVDEVLAVGDAQFQRKCLGKMGDFSKEGRTVLFVSHNMNAILNLCNYGLLIDNGEKVFFGNSEEAVNTYLGSFAKLEHSFANLDHHDGRTTGMSIIAKSIGLRDTESGRNYLTSVKTGHTLIFEIHYDCNDQTVDLVQLGISTMTGQRVFTVGTHLSQGFTQVLQGKGIIECHLPNVILVPGDYTVTVMMGKKVPPHNLDCVENALSFRVEAGDYFGTGQAPLPGQGYLAQKSEWIVNPVK